MTLCTVMAHSSTNEGIDNSVGALLGQRWMLAHAAIDTDDEACVAVTVDVDGGIDDMLACAGMSHSAVDKGIDDTCVRGNGHSAVMDDCTCGGGDGVLVLGR